MTSLRQWLARCAAALSKPRHDADFHAELASHLELSIDENIARGHSPQEARRLALIQLGGLESTKEQHRDARGLPFLETLLQDLRYGARSLRRDLGFTVFAVLIVGLGIGASCTIFSVINTLMLRPLPFANPASLVWMANGTPDEGLSAQTVQVGHLIDLKQRNRSFSDIAAYFAFYGVGDSKLTGQGAPERLSELPVSQNFFPLLGVQPQLGRLFTDDECKFNGPKAVLLSHGFWQRRFAANPDIVGVKMILNDAPATIAGVLPESFDFANVFAPGTRFDLYSPFPLGAETNNYGNTISLIGRLKPGLSLVVAQSEIDALGKQISQQHPERNDLSLQLTYLNEHVSGRLRPALLLLAFAVGVVMLIVCANLSNLLLARTTSRQKEMAVRLALGAGRGRLIRQMLTESLLLSSLGATLGLALAAGGTYALAHLNGINVPLLAQVRLDWTAFAFTLFASLLTGLLFGLVPALQAPALLLHDSLKDSSRGSSEGKGRASIRGALVVAEIAFACVLLVAAGLLIRSFLQVLDVKLGFEPAHTAALRIDPGPGYKTREQQNAYFDEALRLTKAIPGVEAAGLTDALPLGRNRTWGVGARGKVYDKGKYPLAFVRISSDGYLQSMGIPLKAGRDFTARDLPATQPVLIVNESMAKSLWPGENAIGKLVNFGRFDRRVIGIAGDVRHLALEKDSGNEMYVPIRQSGDYASVDLVVRTTMPPAQLADAVRFALRPIEPNLPAGEFRTLQQLVDKSTSPRRLIVILLGGFAAFALVLASLGIYAVISYSVTQRTHEIGIRMALGESALHLQGKIMKHTLGLALLGMAIGAVASWVLGRSLSSLLFGVHPNDPWTFSVMLVSIGAVALLAGYLPARRASHIDPIEALRAG